MPLRADDRHRPLFLILDAGRENPASFHPRLDGNGRSAIHELVANPPGAAGLRTAAGMAASLICRIREAQPRGPYRVTGWGLAGVLAYEIGVQLLGADEEVEFLGLVDADCMSWPTRRARLTEVKGDERAVLERAVLEYDVPRAPLAVHLFTGVATPGRRQTRGWEAVLPPDRIEVVVTTETPDPRHDSDLDLVLQQVEASEQNTGVGKASSGAVPAPSALITIQRGRPGAAPIFCLPGAGAGVADFVHLVGGWGDRSPVHGLQHRGMDGASLPHSTVEAAADAHLREMSVTAPRGEIHLVGHSFGGWIAFEMASRLQAAGRRVSSLTLLDSGFPGGDGRVGREYTRPEVLVQLVTLYELAVQRSFGLTQADLEAWNEEEQLVRLHGRLVEFGLLPKRSPPAVLCGPIRAFESALRTRYRPTATFTGSTRLMLVPRIGEGETESQQRFEQVVQGWRALAPNLVYRRGAGNHISMLKPPHAVGLAEWIWSGMHGGEGGDGASRRAESPALYASRSM